MSDAAVAAEILLVEDNPNDAELAIRALKKHALADRLRWVKDGEEALEALFHTGRYANDPNGKFKVVLLDLRLPKIDGLEVLRRLRADERTKILPVVILTSSKEDRDVVEAYELGANSYIAKPVELDPFMETVSRLGLYWLVDNTCPVGQERR